MSILTISPPPQRVLQVTAFQAREALRQAGLLDTVEAEMAKPDVDPKTKLAWEYAGDVKRYSTMTLDIATRLNLTDEQLDVLFLAASQVD